MDKVTEGIVRATFSNHYYKWGASIRKQSKGGSQGLRGTGSVARTTMDDWAVKFRDKVETLGIKIYLLKKYVDDVLIISSLLKLGSRWNGTQIVCFEEDRLQDEAEGRSRSEVTMEVLRAVTSSIHSFFNFTAEASGGADHPLPCLDTQLWYGATGGATQWYPGEDTRNQIIQVKD